MVDELVTAEIAMACYATVAARFRAEELSRVGVRLAHVAVTVSLVVEGLQAIVASVLWRWIRVSRANKTEIHPTYCSYHRGGLLTSLTFDAPTRRFPFFDSGIGHKAIVMCMLGSTVAFQWEGIMISLSGPIRSYRPFFTWSAKPPIFTKACSIKLSMSWAVLV